MIPSRRNALPEWEISLDQHVIGWVQEWRPSTSSRPFYRAIGIDPDTGKRVNLESSTGFDERILTVREFHDHPEASLHRRAGFIPPR